MRTLTLIARILLGLVFTVFGLNGFLHFIANPPPPNEGLKFFIALNGTGYMLKLIFGSQFFGGVLVLVGFVPIGMVLLAPVIVNILMYHLYLDPAGIGPGAFAAILELFLVWRYWPSFAPLFSFSLSAPESAS